MKELEEKIEAKKAERATLVDEIEPMVKNFIELTANHLSDKCLDVAAHFGKVQSDKTTELGAERVKKLADHIRGLSSKFLEICKERMLKPSAWAHLRIPGQRFKYHDYAAHDIRGVPDRNVGHHILDCLTEFQSHLQSAGYKFGDASTGFRDPILGERFGWSPDMETAFNEISKRESRLCDIDREIEILSLQNQMAEAAKFGWLRTSDQE
jgi:hypothetical protein